MVTRQGSPGNETVGGRAGADLLEGLDGDDILTGLQGEDELIGGRGNDRLNGGKGKDRMFGGAGNDTYVVDTVGDRVNETTNQGYDRIESYINLDLRKIKNIEDVTLLGNAAINATGDRHINILIGNQGNNQLLGLGGSDRLYGGPGGNDVLDGGVGSDIMVGNPGKNTFYIDNSGDSILNSGPGIDTVISSVGYTLVPGAENLTLTKKAVIGNGNNLRNTLTGNAARNILRGGNGADKLLGLGGDDTLNGGSGADTFMGMDGNDNLIGGAGGDLFRYETGSAFRAADVGIDNIRDFQPNQDIIVLSKTTFGLASSIGPGFSNSNEFAVVANNDLASSSSARIVFSRGSRTLFLNTNGASADFGAGGSSGAFASLNRPVISDRDFLITA